MSKKRVNIIFSIFLYGEELNYTFFQKHGAMSTYIKNLSKIWLSPHNINENLIYFEKYPTIYYHLQNNTTIKVLLHEVYLEIYDTK